MSLWHAALLGLVQGLTEFLPVSSTAHLVVVRTWLGHPHADDAFTVVVQLGTLLAVYGYFRREIAGVFGAVWQDITMLELGHTPAGWLGWLILVGTVPAGLAGLLLKKWLKANFYTLPAMGAVAIGFAVLMLAAEWWGRRRAGRGEDKLTLSDAVWVGCWQALALMPGGSRSGCTITGGLFAGLSREAATRFSFLLSVPIITAAGLKELYDEWKKLTVPVPDEPPSLFASGDQLLALGVGTAVAAAVGYLCIAGLLAFLRRYSTGVFVGYRLLFGGLLLAGVGQGAVGPPPVAPPPVAAGTPTTLTGRVVWPGTGPVPPPRVITDAQWPGTPPGTVDEELLVDPATRGVRNVVVWLADEPGDRTARPLRQGLADRPPATHAITAGPTQFSPRVVVARGGDTLAVRPAAPHRVEVGGERRTALTLVAGPRPVPISAEPLGWMRAWAWAFDHPFAAVTGPDGRFSIPDAPPGRRRLVVWHERGFHRNATGGTPIDLPAGGTHELPAVELTVP
jgi:undecaprenyl-diphosphatase